MSQTLLQPTEPQEQPQTVPAERPQEAVVPAPQQALEERIRNRAYELFESRGGAPGDPDDDWYRAEAEIIGQPGETDH
jgi:hypothetical protein